MKGAVERYTSLSRWVPEGSETGRSWMLCLTLVPLILLVPSFLGQESGQPGKHTETVTLGSGEKLSFELMELPGGTFTMGSPETEPGRSEDEGPRRVVRLSPFYLSSTEVTLELFLAFYRETVTEEKVLSGRLAELGVDAITGPTPIYGDLTMGRDLNHPAIGMSWLNAVAFCKWLSKKTGREYRLPTEAEWEYGCRAGTSDAFGTVDDDEQLREYAWYDENSDGTTRSVGSRKPNAWGLHDMSGNVREWVSDFYRPGGYSPSASEEPVWNPKGPDSGKVHVARGGDYRSFPEELRCSARAYEVPEWHDLDPQIPRSKWWLPFIDVIGFRVARSVE